MSKAPLTPSLVYVSGGATLVFMYAFYNRPELILFSFAVLGLIMLGAINRGRYVFWYIAASVLGPIILDIPGLHLGLWSYGTPQIFGFPFWLPFFYGNVTVSFLYFVRAHPEL